MAMKLTAMACLFMQESNFILGSYIEQRRWLHLRIAKKYPGLLVLGSSIVISSTKKVAV